MHPECDGEADRCIQKEGVYLQMKYTVLMFWKQGLGVFYELAWGASVAIRHGVRNDNSCLRNPSKRQNLAFSAPLVQLLLWLSR